MRVDAKRMEAIQARADAAFKGPWTHDTFTVECSLDDPRCPDPTPDDCEGEREALRIEAPEEYPDGQVVCDVYGLETFAGPNAAFLAEARTDVPDLLADLRDSRQLAENLEIRLMETERNRLLAVERAERAEAEFLVLETRLRAITRAAKHLALATPDKVLRSELERTVRLANEVLPPEGSATP